MPQFSLFFVSETHNSDNYNDDNTSKSLVFTIIATIAVVFFSTDSLVVFEHEQWSQQEGIDTRLEKRSTSRP